MEPKQIGTRKEMVDGIEVEIKIYESAEEATASDEASTNLAVIPAGEIVPEPEVLVQEAEEVAEEEPSQSVIVFARDAEEMAMASSKLAAWVGEKLRLLRQEARELEENLEIAKRSKWKISTLQKHTELARSRITYYQKMKDAVESGYTIIPEFPMEVFAVRLTKMRLPANVGTGIEQRVWPSAKAESGSGEYVGPQAKRTRNRQWENEAKQRWWDFKTVGTQAVAFPMTAVRPEIMTATSQAMAAKIFDEIGIVIPGKRESAPAPEVPSREVRADPMIVGRISGAHRSCMFLICWFLDSRTL
jgi:hypothetical protein